MIFFNTLLSIDLFNKKPLEYLIQELGEEPEVTPFASPITVKRIKEAREAQLKAIYKRILKALRLELNKMVEYLKEIAANDGTFGSKFPFIGLIAGELTIEAIDACSKKDMQRFKKIIVAARYFEKGYIDPEHDIILAKPEEPEADILAIDSKEYDNVLNANTLAPIVAECNKLLNEQKEQILQKAESIMFIEDEIDGPSESFECLNDEESTEEEEEEESEKEYNFDKEDDPYLLSLMQDAIKTKGHTIGTKEDPYLLSLMQEQDAIETKDHAIGTKEEKKYL